MAYSFRSHHEAFIFAERVYRGRAMTAVSEDAVLHHGQSLHYDHVIRDLVVAEWLVPNVEDWLGHLSQEDYHRRVATEHRQKRAFWQRMERAGLPWRG